MVLWKEEMETDELILQSTPAQVMFSGKALLLIYKPLSMDLTLR